MPKKSGKKKQAELAKAKEAEEKKKSAVANSKQNDKPTAKRKEPTNSNDDVEPTAKRPRVSTKPTPETDESTASTADSLVFNPADHVPDTIFVSGLPKGLTAADIGSMFEHIGPIDRIEILEQRDDMAFVRFQVDECVPAAIKMMNGKQMDKFRLCVSRARSEAFKIREREQHKKEVADKKALLEKDGKKLEGTIKKKHPWVDLDQVAHSNANSVYGVSGGALATATPQIASSEQDQSPDKKAAAAIDYGFDDDDDDE